MNCPRCGALVASGATICPQCALPVAQMQAPLPKKKNTATIIVIVVLAALTVPIFLIAILAAILFPVFQKTRENARLAVCESNAKQIELALLQYSQDHNNTYPASATNYESALKPYTMDTERKLFHCPDDTPGAESYSLNAKLQGYPLAKMSKPSAVVSVYEGKNGKLEFRHSGKAVVGFADGHVRAIRPEQAASLQWQP